MPFEMHPDERALGSWTVHHEWPGRRPVTGSLIVTNLRILFDPKMEASTRSLVQLGQSASDGWKAGNAIAIDRRQVTGIDADKGFFAKRALVLVEGGPTFVFNRGMMSIDPILAALQQR